MGRLTSALHGGNALVLDAARVSKELAGEAIAANLVMLGAAFQRGLLPVSRAAIERAIELNGVSVESNLRAFEWGRRAAHDPSLLQGAMATSASEPPTAPSLDALIEKRAAQLRVARGRRDEARYRALVGRVRTRERDLGLGEALTAAVARSHHRLLAVKDEWEVARLFAEPDFARTLGETFEGDYRVHVHLGAWPFAKTDPRTGAVVKREAGPWALTAFRAMARLRVLRGTILDPFRANAERRLEQRLLAEFEGDVEATLARLTPANHAAAVRLLGLAATIKGYGRVKEASAAEAAKARAAALEAFTAPDGPPGPEALRTRMEMAA